MILNIIEYDNDQYGILRKKNIDVEKENPYLQKLVDDMIDTLKSTDGIGLAAPQIGKNLNIFIINLPDLQEIFINPEVELNGMFFQCNEGCLSFPDLQIPVLRRGIVKIKYFDINWNYHIKEFKDLPAIVIQHEFDHLNGILIID